MRSCESDSSCSIPASVTAVSPRSNSRSWESLPICFSPASVTSVPLRSSSPRLVIRRKLRELVVGDRHVGQFHPQPHVARLDLLMADPGAELLDFGLEARLLAGLRRGGQPASAARQQPAGKETGRTSSFLVH